MKGWSSRFILACVTVLFIFSNAHSFDCEEYLTKYANSKPEFERLNLKEFLSLLSKADDALTDIQSAECVRQYGKVHPIWTAYLSGVQGSGDNCIGYACTRCSKAEALKGKYDTEFKINCPEIIDKYPGDEIFFQCSLEQIRKADIPLRLGECSLTTQKPY